MIILKRNDGHIAVMLVVDNKEDAIKKFKEQHPEFIEHVEVDDIKLPSRQFRDAWELQGKQIVVNEDKAKNIQLERIRQVRNQKLEELDKEQLRHLASPGMAVEIENKKQLLRDAMANIVVDIAKSPIEALQDVLAV